MQTGTRQTFENLQLGTLFLFSIPPAGEKGTTAYKKVDDLTTHRMIRSSEGNQLNWTPVQTDQLIFSVTTKDAACIVIGSAQLLPRVSQEAELRVASQLLSATNQKDFVSQVLKDLANENPQIAEYIIKTCGQSADQLKSALDLVLLFLMIRTQAEIDAQEEPTS